MVFKNNPSNYENMIQLMPCKNSCRLYIHLAFTSFGPSGVVWSKLRLAPPFPPMRVLEVQWSRALSLVCEAALRSSPLMKPQTGLEVSICFVDLQRQGRRLRNCGSLGLFWYRLLHPCAGDATNTLQWLHVAYSKVTAYIMAWIWRLIHPQTHPCSSRFLE